MSSRLVARNSAVLLAAQVVGRVAGLGTFMLVARALTKEDVGRFGSAMALVGFLTLAVDFGFDLVVTRETGRSGTSGGAALAARLKTVLFLIGFPLLIVAAFPATGWGAELGLVAILGAAVWHESITRTLSAYYLARGRAEFGFVYETVASLVRFLAVAVVLWTGARLVGLGVAYFVATGVAAVGLGSWALRHGFSLRSEHSPRATRDLLVEAAYFAIYQLLFQAYFRLDVVLLRYMRPAAEAGHYVVAFRAIEVLLTIPAVLTGALYPVLSSLEGSGDTKGFQEACAGTTRWLTVIGGALCLGTWVASPLVVRIMAGRGFDEAAVLLPLLLPALALICLNCVGLLSLNAVGRQRWNAGIMLAGAVTKLAWNLSVIPHYGAIGACVGSFVTELVVTVAIVACARRWYPTGVWVQAWWRGGAAAVVAAAVAVVVPGQLVIRLTATLGTFVVAAFVTGAVERSDLETLGGWLRSRVARADKVS